LGGAKLKSIQYLFLQDELIRVFIRSDSSNSDALKRIVLEKLGNPTFTDKDYKSEIYHWKRNITEAYFKESEEEGFFVISDINAQQKEEDYKNQIAKEGAEKGF